MELSRDLKIHNFRACNANLRIFLTRCSGIIIYESKVKHTNDFFVC